MAEAQAIALTASPEEVRKGNPIGLSKGCPEVL